MPNKKSQQAYILAWAKRIKAIKTLGGKCKRCGCSDFKVLEFHHIRDKVASINNLKDKRWSLINEEIQKCHLLCVNCHSEIHFKNGKRGNKGSILFNREAMVCSECGYRGDNIASLAFHHMNAKEKSFGISDALVRKIKVSAIELEIELKKCKLICKNCHRKNHFNNEEFQHLQDEIESKMETYRETPHEIDKRYVATQIALGATQSDIVAELGCSKGSISNITGQLGLRKNREKTTYEKICLNCNNRFETERKSQTFCSKRCAVNRVNLPDLDEIIRLRKSHTLREIGNMFGVSHVTVYKRLNRPLV